MCELAAASLSLSTHLDLCRLRVDATRKLRNLAEIVLLVFGALLARFAVLVDVHGEVERCVRELVIDKVSVC